MAQPRLELFDAPPDPLAPDPIAKALEDARTAGETAGYAAGWQAALAHSASDHSQLNAQIAHHLQDLAFTWAEARAHVTLSLEPLIRAMIAQLLPKIAQASLVPMILEWMQPAIEDAADQPAELSIHPSAHEAISRLLNDSPGLPFRIGHAPELGPNEVVLRLGPREASLDLSRVIAEITAACDAFFTHQQERLSNGRSDRG